MQQQASPFIELSPDEQNDIILRTAAKLNIAPVLIEKDFWVSWLLNKIFSLHIAKDITFKGGTSLSKCYGIISRFSEDIDLTIDRNLFVGGTNETGLSGKAFQRLIKSTELEGSIFVNDIFKPKLEASLSSTLEEKSWSIVKDENEPKNLRFFYPSAQKQAENAYVQQSILIEFGVRGDITPSEDNYISSHIEQSFSELVSLEQAPIRTLSPLRTFWEKITLIHSENNRPKDKVFGDRLSRHYYDIYQLIHKGIAEKALKDISLLHDVIKHKSKYFKSAWATYETAVPPTLSIFPNDTLKQKLKEDYKQMRGMLFGNPPSFDEILEAIEKFQNEVNAASPSTKTLCS